MVWGRASYPGCGSCHKQKCRTASNSPWGRSVHSKDESVESDGAADAFPVASDALHLLLSAQGGSIALEADLDNLRKPSRTPSFNSNWIGNS